MINVLVLDPTVTQLKLLHSS